MTHQQQQELIVPTLVALTLLAFILYHVKKFSFWRQRGINGPMPWPFLGTNIYYIFRNKVEVDLGWHKKYGKTYGFYDGYNPILRTIDNDVIKHVYIKQFPSFTDRNTSFIHGDNIKNWLLWSKGDHWANQRTLVSPMFTSNKMKSMMPTMANCIDNFIREAYRRMGKLHSIESTNGHTGKVTSGSGETNFSRDDMMSMSLDVIAQSFFSIKVDTYRDRANEFLKKAYEFARFDLYWYIIWLMIPEPLARYFKIDFVRYKRFEYFDKLSNSIIQDRRSNPTAAKKNDFIQAMLDAKIPDQYERVYSAEDDKEAHYNDKISHQELEKIQESQTKAAKLFRNFSDLEIRGSMTFFFIAGFETTASTISFCLYELAHQPGAQLEIYEELRKKFPIEPGQQDVTKLDIEYSDLLDCKKIDALVSEVMRLYSPLVENNRIVTDQEGAMVPTKPKPIYLPPGTAISTNFYCLQRDGDYFERPDEFDLTRFYPENRDKLKSCTYMPFGVGPRNCAGMRFALFEVKLALAKLILNFKIEPGHQSATYPPSYKNNITFLQFQKIDFKLTPR